MSFDPDKAAARSLRAVKQLLKGDGKLSGVFYAASQGKAGPAGVIIETTVKDSSGAKTLGLGMKMKGALDADIIARGLVAVDAKRMELRAQKSRGSLKLLKLALFKHLTQSDRSPDAKKLGKLLKKSAFVQAGPDGPEPELDEADEADVAEVEEAGPISDEELTELGLEGEDISELLSLQALTGDQLDQLAGVLREDEDAEALAAARERLSARFDRLRQRLADSASFAHLPPETQGKIRAGVEAQLELLRTAQASGGDFLDVDVGDTLDGEFQLMVDLVHAQRDHLKAHRGHRTLGLENEWSHALKVTARMPLPDHTLLFETENIKFTFELQGGDSGKSGQIEAITKRPIDVDDPGDRDRLQQQLDEIRKVSAVFDSLDTSKLDGAGLLAKLKAAGVPVTAGGGLKAVSVRLRDEDETIKRMPQVTMTESLSTIHRSFSEGFPDVLQSKKADTDMRSAIMKDSAAAADKMFAAIAEAAGGEVDSPTVDADRVKGFLTLMVQNVKAMCVHMDETYTDSTGKEHSYDGWFKDHFGLLCKTPLGLLANGGGLSPDELALVRGQLETLFAQLEEVAEGQGVDDIDEGYEDSEGDTMPSIRRYVTQIFEPPPKEARRTKGYDDWLAEYKAWQIDADARWKRELKKKPKQRRKPVPPLSRWKKTWAKADSWYAYRDWEHQKKQSWHDLIGDSTSASIVQHDDDGSMRVAFEYRQLAGQDDGFDEDTEGPLLDKTVGTLLDRLQRHGDQREEDSLREVLSDLG